MRLLRIPTCSTIALLASAITCAAIAAQTAGPGPACSGADAELKTLVRDLNRDAFDDAKRLVAQLEASHDGCPALLLAKARILAADGFPTAAGRAFSEYGDKMPDDAEGLAYFVRFLIGQGQYSQIEEFSSDVLRRAPDSPIALSVRGQVLAMQGHSEQARELLERSAGFDPEDVETQFQLGSVLDHLRRPESAVEHFQKSVEMDPGHAQAWDYLALNLEPLGQLDRAEAAYRQGIAVNREGPHYDAFLEYNYGRFLMKRNRLPEAKKSLDKAVDLVPDCRATWYDRAKLNLRMGDYAQARSDGERALAVTGNTGGILDLQVYVLLEQVYRRLGEKQLADKYAALARETPSPVRKDLGPVSQQ